LLFRIKYKDGTYKTLTNLCKVNNKNYKELLDNYKIALDYKDNNYLTIEIEKIIISYYIIPNGAARSALETKESKIGRSVKYQPIIEYFTFNGYKLPNTMDFDS
jgi:hypothetical protein